ncbi:MAG: hypothetical protein ACE5FU_09115, partial [Nitrospinota bacterium]
RALFSDRLHGAVFVDSGEIWSRESPFSGKKVKTGAGFELRLDMVVGYLQKVIPTVGFAHGFNTGGNTRFYLYINYGFDFAGSAAAIF